MAEKEDARSETPKSDNLLLNLPTFLIEYICQLLIDRAESFDKLSHVGTLRDVMSLRASCSILNDVIKDLTLYVPCKMTLDQLKSPRNDDYFGFIEFMRSETNWLFRSLTIQAEIVVNEIDLMAFFLRNGALFRNSLEKVKLWFSNPRYCDMITDLPFKWFEQIKLNNNPSVEIFFWALNFRLSNPEMISIARIVEFKNGICPDVLLSFSNLTELYLYGNNFEIDKFNYFPNLKVLSVGNLRHSNGSSFYKYPILPTMKYLKIICPEDNNVLSLPRIIEKCFPCLISIEFSHFRHSIQNMDLDFSNLPSSCKFLKTEARFLPFFAKCSNIKSVSIFYDSNFDSIQVYLNNSRINFLFLEIIFHHSPPVTLTSLTGHIINLLMYFHSIEALSFKHSLPFKTETSAMSLFDGKADFDVADFLRSQVELRQLFVDWNLQLLILGKTAFMKKSGNPALLRELFPFAAFYPPHSNMTTQKW